MKKFAVISHTHWDREWYKPFEVFRIKLVRLIDEVLEIIEENEDYIFHLDAQTVVLEDYLAIRPEKEDVLKNFIASGNIIVGPWYLQNDFYLTSGEATVRNLLYGREVADRFGRCSNVGYMPDQFGIISAMPQILNGFGIKSAVFGRGYMEYTIENGTLKRLQRPSEFLWKSRDGSCVLGVFLQRWYNNAQRLPKKSNALKELLKANEKGFECSNAPTILLMNGVDHLFPQSDALSVINSVKEFALIKQTSLDSYVFELCEYFKSNPDKIGEYTGSLDKGTDYEILKGCRSSRIYLKQENVKVQDLLENKLEPLYSLLELKGIKGVYPFGELKYLWKSLLKMHPHDNICGCSTDTVHKHMEDGFEKIQECGSDLLERGMEILARHTKISNNENAYVITVFNPTERVYCGVAEVNIDIPVEENPENLRIVDGQNKEIYFEIVNRKKMTADYYSDYNLPVMRDIYRYHLRLNTCVNAYSYKNYILTTVKKKYQKANSDLSVKDVENEFYVIGFDCVPYLIDKRTQKRIENPFYFEYSADRGDSYVYRNGSESLEFYANKFSVVENTLLKKSVVLEYLIVCPEKYDFKAMEVSRKNVSFIAKITVSLYKKSDVVEIKYAFNNKASDCRLRLALKSGLNNAKTYSDEPYNYLERLPMENCAVSDSNVHHNTSFIFMQADDNFEIFTEGQHEFEIKDSSAFITVLRATGVIARNEFTFKEGGEGWRVPGNQVHGKINGKMGVRLSEKGCASDTYVKAKQFRCGILARGFSVNKKKFLYGSATLQTSSADNVYLEKDKFKNLFIDDNVILETDNKNIVVTSIKKSENKNDFVVRLLNYSDCECQTRITTPYIVSETDLAEKAERVLSKNEVISFTPKQIKTYKLKVK